MTPPRWLRALGLPGCLGVGLLLAGAWGLWAWMPPQKQALDDTASHVRRLRRELLDAAPAAQASATPSGWQLEGLDAQTAWSLAWEALPDESLRVNLISEVMQPAGKLGVVIASVQYSGAAEPWSQRDGQALWRQRMVMPVEGRYADVRAWLAQLLRQSSLSVDALSLTRDDTTSDLVKGRVSVSLWWRAAQGEH